jgi:hypothetical protein
MALSASRYLSAAVCFKSILIFLPVITLLGASSSPDEEHELPLSSSELLLLLSLDEDEEFSSAWCRLDFFLSSLDDEDFFFL